MTVDSAGMIYLTTEAGGGEGKPQLLVLGSTATAAMPEPARLAMLVGGSGLVGGAIRRRPGGVRRVVTR